MRECPCKILGDWEPGAQIRAVFSGCKARKDAFSFVEGDEDVHGTIFYLVFKK